MRLAGQTPILKKLQEELDKTKADRETLHGTVKTLTEEKKTLQETLDAKNGETKDDATSDFEDILAQIPVTEINRFDLNRNRRLADLLSDVSHPLGYDWKPASAMIPKKPLPYGARVIQLPTAKTHSDLRKNMPVYVPKTLQDIQYGRGHFSIPVHDTIHPNKKGNAKIDTGLPDVQKFLHEKIRSTPFLRNYGENSVNWSVDKVARDLLQNFYDGHGHTLEGVKFDLDFNPQTGKYKVKVSGDGEFNHHEIEDLGAGNKNEDANNAGGYGEGSKVFTVRLLAKHNVEHVTYRSGDWKLSFQMGDDDGHDQDRVYKKLSQVPTRSGNSVEFETEDAALVQAILRAGNYFYHPENPDFHQPTFENVSWGFKYLGLQKKGNLYLAGQRFETPKSENWSNELSGLTVYGKRKPLASAIDYGRDRSSLTPEELGKILEEDYVKTMSSEELVQAIWDLSEVWTPVEVANQTKINFYNLRKDHPPTILLHALLKEADWNRNFHIDFPENGKYLALPGNMNSVSKDILQDLQQKGYRLCDPGFARLGMTSVVDFVKQQRQHKPLQPTAVEAQKIQILKKAAEILLADLSTSKKNDEEPLTRQEDIAQPLYLFDRFTERDMEDLRAEAITEKKPEAWHNPYSTRHKPNQDEWHAPRVFKGAWFDRTYLREGSFEELLATYLHELTHQYGGDESKEFSYRLTDWMKEMNASLIRNGESRQKLNDLMMLWDQISEPGRAKAG
jgi:hypothetical protein